MTTPTTEEEPSSPVEEPGTESPAPSRPDPPSSDGGPALGTSQPAETGDPPPLPPLVETGVSTVATATSGLYAATGVAGLVTAAGVTAAGAVAYGLTRRRTRARSGAGRAGTAGGAGSRTTSRMGRLGRMLGLSGGSRGACGTRTGGGRSSTRRGTASRSGGTGTGRSSGGGGLFGSAGGARAGRSAGRSGGSGSRGGGADAAGRGRSGGLFGGSPGTRSSGGGLFGATGGGRAGPSGGRSSGGLFGRSRGAHRSAGRGRGSTTKIVDPAPYVAKGLGMRSGWDRIRPRAVRMRRYLANRRWALRVRSWWARARGMATHWWDRLRGRVSTDPRYGRLSGVQLGIAAAAVGALGAAPQRSQPRVLVGRVIGTAAPVPGTITGPTRRPFELPAVTSPVEEAAMATEVQRVTDATDELRNALASLGGSQVGMLTYEMGLRQLAPVLKTLAEGFSEMGTTAEDEQPLAPEVTEFFHTISQAVHASAEVADELPGLFRAAHETELARLENPRVAEAKWDVSAQD
ncbi:hypothetical protein RIF23_14745 [Lipingzhangella sp. LS1_29]|uniref:Uncharacterized protein n=1 Tax=Lipingzhangella rawalii TaxID=2055835 RepID=A0ABU2H8C0_9ACTN|nr:hypothetical protein [Lipingzhangella rawalii]MDS1271555.1 hypothetical protein [Lipingzhangella rawalii]